MQNTINRMEKRFQRNQVIAFAAGVVIFALGLVGVSLTSIREAAPPPEPLSGTCWEFTDHYRCFHASGEYTVTVQDVEVRAAWTRTHGGHVIVTTLGEVPPRVTGDMGIHITSGVVDDPRTADFFDYRDPAAGPLVGTRTTYHPVTR